MDIIEEIADQRSKHNHHRLTELALELVPPHIIQAKSDGRFEDVLRLTGAMLDIADELLTGTFVFQREPHTVGYGPDAKRLVAHSAVDNALQDGTPIDYLSRALQLLTQHPLQFSCLAELMAKMEGRFLQELSLPSANTAQVEGMMQTLVSAWNREDKTKYTLNGRRHAQRLADAAPLQGQLLPGALDYLLRVAGDPDIQPSTRINLHEWVAQRACLALQGIGKLTLEASEHTRLATPLSGHFAQALQGMVIGAERMVGLRDQCSVLERALKLSAPDSAFHEETTALLSLKQDAWGKQIAPQPHVGRLRRSIRAVGRAAIAVVQVIPFRGVRWRRSSWENRPL